MKTTYEFYYVYKITNLINFKLYIGKSYDPSHRVTQHLNNAFSDVDYRRNECPKFYNSLRAYGIENFKFEIIDIFDTEDFAYLAEEGYTYHYDTVENGLNTVYGGFGGSSGENNRMFGKGYLISGEKNGMFGRTGELNPFFGKEHSKDFIKGIKLQNRVLTNEQVLEIKDMINKRINYSIIGEKFDIGDVTIHRIKTGERYADVGEPCTAHKYNKFITDEEIEYIVTEWMKDPKTKNGILYTLAFHTDKIEGKFNLSKAALGCILRGGTWRHITQKLNYISPFASNVT